VTGKNTRSRRTATMPHTNTSSALIVVDIPRSRPTHTSSRRSSLPSSKPVPHPRVCSHRTSSATSPCPPGACSPRAPRTWWRCAAPGTPGRGRSRVWRFDPTPNGFVLELDEAWTADGEHWTCRELFRADISDDGITQLSSTAPATGTRPDGRSTPPWSSSSALSTRGTRRNSYPGHCAGRTGRHELGGGARRARDSVRRGTRRRRRGRDGGGGTSARGCAAVRRPRRADAALLHEALSRRARPAGHPGQARRRARPVLGVRQRRPPWGAVAARRSSGGKHRRPDAARRRARRATRTSWGPDDLAERLHVTARLQDVAAHVDDCGTRMDAHLWR